MAALIIGLSTPDFLNKIDNALGIVLSPGTPHPNGTESPIKAILGIDLLSVWFPFLKPY